MTVILCLCRNLYYFSVTRSVTNQLLNKRLSVSWLIQPFSRTSGRKASNWVIAEYQTRKRPPSLYGSIRICLKCWGKNDKWVKIPNYRAQIQTRNLPSINQNFHPPDHKFRTLHLTEAITPYARISPKISFRAIWIRKFSTQTDSYYISGISRRAIIVSFQSWSKILVVTNLKIFYFKHSPCSECCILSFVWFPEVWILRPRFGNAASSSFIGGVSLHQLTQGHTTYETGTDRLFRNVGTKFRRRGITQKEEYKLKDDPTGGREG